jgi:TPR repeat protein
MLQHRILDDEFMRAVLRAARPYWCIAIGICLGAWLVTSQEARAQKDRTYDQGISAYNERSYDKAVEVWWPLAEAGDRDAQVGIALAYVNDSSVPDEDRMYDWLEKQASAGRSQAQCPLARVVSRPLFGRRVSPYIASKVTRAGAFEAVRSGARTGDVECEFLLGQFHYLGIGTKVDVEAGARWWSLAAGRGHASAQANLGQAYRTGIGIRRDFNRAFVWSFVSAAKGNSVAQKNLQTLLADPPDGWNVRQGFEFMARALRIRTIQERVEIAE